jgi:hypothetical protein
MGGEKKIQVWENLISGDHSPYFKALDFSSEAGLSPVPISKLGCQPAVEPSFDFGLTKGLWQTGDHSKNKILYPCDA